MRMNISVPDDLREEMKPFDEATNWSSVAAAAFKKEVELRQRLVSIDDAVKRRLLATDAEDDEQVKEMGHRAGETWAKSSARMIHLRRLAAAASEEGLDYQDPDGIATAINGGKPSMWADLPNVSPLPDPVAIESGWCEGFVEGALTVYEAVSQ